MLLSILNSFLLSILLISCQLLLFLYCITSYIPTTFSLYIFFFILLCNGSFIFMKLWKFLFKPLWFHLLINSFLTFFYFFIINLNILALHNIFNFILLQMEACIFYILLLQLTGTQSIYALCPLIRIACLHQYFFQFFHSSYTCRLYFLRYTGTQFLIKTLCPRLSVDKSLTVLKSQDIIGSFYVTWLKSKLSVVL